MMTDERIYDCRNVVSFAKIADEWGRFSNMYYSALFVNETFIPSVEALYQSCKFPLYPDIQKEIISQDNGMKAKIVSRRYSSYQRQDWDLVKYSVMEWGLMVKLIQDWDEFAPLLKKTEKKEIVEYSSKDAEWGAIRYDDHRLRGKNILGRMLMHIRDEYVTKGIRPQFIPPLQIASFQLYGNNIGRVYPTEYYDDFLEEY